MSLERVSDTSAVTSVVTFAWSWSSANEIVQFIAGIIAILAGCIAIAANLRRLK